MLKCPVHDIVSFCMYMYEASLHAYGGNPEVVQQHLKEARSYELKNRTDLQLILQVLLHNIIYIMLLQHNLQSSDPSLDSNLQRLTRVARLGKR